MIDTSVFQGKTAAYYTLGCKLNFSETSTFARLLGEMGVRTATKGERADIVLIKTAETLAAVAGHTEVTKEDLREAAHLALPHRMRRRPFEEQKLDWENVDKVIDG
jgi:Mg-chelatase subunit ChlI